MLLIPAIDLKDGACVRLRQGRMDDATIFSQDVIATASQWVSQGARRLHMVDLNGAFAGHPLNAQAVRRVSEHFPDLPIQVGGGIRTLETAQAYFDAGVQWIIIGTQAVRDPDLVKTLCAQHPGRIIVGLDARDGMVAVDGWANATAHRAIDLARSFEGIGVSAIVYTDIGRDGMLQGPNLAATAELVEAISIPVIASGGVSTLDDVRRLCALEADGVAAAIVGRALYDGGLKLADAQALADSVTRVGS